MPYFGAPLYCWRGLFICLEAELTLEFQDNFFLFLLFTTRGVKNPLSSLPPQFHIFPSLGREEEGVENGFLQFPLEKPFSYSFFFFRRSSLFFAPSPPQA